MTTTEPLPIIAAAMAQRRALGLYFRVFEPDGRTRFTGYALDSAQLGRWISDAERAGLRWDNPA